MNHGAASPRGYVIQQTGLLPHLTVSANIGLPFNCSYS